LQSENDKIKTKVNDKVWGCNLLKANRSSCDVEDIVENVNPEHTEETVATPTYRAKLKQNICLSHKTTLPIKLKQERITRHSKASEEIGQVTNDNSNMVTTSKECTSHLNGINSCLSQQYKIVKKSKHKMSNESMPRTPLRSIGKAGKSFLDKSFNMTLLNDSGDFLNLANVNSSCKDSPEHKKNIVEKSAFQVAGKSLDNSVNMTLLNDSGDFSNFTNINSACKDSLQSEKIIDNKPAFQVHEKLDLCAKNIHKKVQNSNLPTPEIKCCKAKLSKNKDPDASTISFSENRESPEEGKKEHNQKISACAVETVTDNVALKGFNAKKSLEHLNNQKLSDDFDSKELSPLKCLSFEEINSSDGVVEEKSLENLSQSTTESVSKEKG